MEEAEARARLIAAIGTAGALPVHADVWRAAAVLGGLRQAANDSLRANHRSRGDDKNASGDLQGAFGELLVAATIEARLPDASVTCAPLNWDEPGNDVDAQVRLGTHTFLVEAKCHLHEPNKRLLLINGVAAERSQARGAKSFVPVLSAAGSSVALIGTPLLMSEVFGWRLRDFGYGDAARSAELETVVREHFDRSFIEARDAVCHDRVVAPDELAHLAAAARARFEMLRSSGLEIPVTPRAAIALFAQSV